MLTIQNLSYTHLNKDLLFNGINLTLNKYQKIALIGTNGAGKSTLLKIIANKLEPTTGQINRDLEPYYVPQIFGQYNQSTIAEALQIDCKLNALKAILKGEATQENFNLLSYDWTIEERCLAALKYWNLSNLDLSQKMETLSGGQKTKVFLAGIAIHQSEFIILDEPTNHLDSLGRNLLYDLIQTTKSTLIVVSHDRKLLNLLNTICELSKNEIKIYGGNFDSYKEQKAIETNALNQDIHSKERAFKKAKEKERETLERQLKLDNRGKRKQEKAGISRIMMNTLRNKAENSSAKLKNAHAEKIGIIKQELQDLRATVADIYQMKFDFDQAKLPKRKKLFIANEINFSYKNEISLWKENLNFQITSGERIHFRGANGSGKTSLIKIILGHLKPQFGSVFIAENKAIYIDQDYSLINNDYSVFQQAQQFNKMVLQEHDIRIRLNRFLFSNDSCDKSCNALSGGERMRLMLCCLNIANQSPDIIILDEPTNNLDIQNIEILTNAINQYKGTLIVVSHDETFLNQINIDRFIEL